MSQSTSTYQVAGMTCQHCVASVVEEVSELEAIQGVEVDLPSGTLTVTGSASKAQIAQAVLDAGYELVS